MIDYSKFKAVIIGHAVADALGVPVEFSSREELSENPVTDMMGYGTYPVPEGSFSDDTSMSLATLDALSRGGIDYDRIMTAFSFWIKDGEYTPTGTVFDIGSTCFSAISEFLLYENKSALECGLCEEHSLGNGSLMRIHPAALYLYMKGYSTPSALEVIRNTSKITHAHERAMLGCEIYSLVLWELLKNPSKASVRKALFEAGKLFSDNPEISHYERLICRISGIKKEKNSSGISTVSIDEIKSTGYVVYTLEAAIWCLLNTESYEECVLAAVNLGEDTDTVAAVAGSLAGALYGYEDIPAEWINTLMRLEYIESLLERAYSEFRKQI